MGEYVGLDLSNKEVTILNVVSRLAKERQEFTNNRNKIKELEDKLLSLQTEAEKIHEEINKLQDDWYSKRRIRTEAEVEFDELLLNIGEKNES